MKRNIFFCITILFANASYSVVHAQSKENFAKTLAIKLETEQKKLTELEWHFQYYFKEFANRQPSELLAAYSQYKKEIDAQKKIIKKLQIQMEKPK